MSVDPWSLGVAVGAVVVAGWSAVSAHQAKGEAKRSADASERVAHLELTPRLQLHYKGRTGQQVDLLLINDGPVDLETIDWTMTGDQSNYLIGMNSGAVSVGHSASIGPLGIGEERPTNVLTIDERWAGMLRLPLRCRAGADEWTVPTEVEVPGIPQVVNLGDFIPPPG